MKRIVFAALFAFLFIPLYSQTLGYRHEKDNQVQAGTNYYFEGKSAFLVNFNPRTAVALEYLFDKDTENEVFSLDFLLQTYELEFSFDKNANVYIKTFQDRVITLHQTKGCGEIKKDRKRVSDRSDSFYYYVYPEYIIPKEDLTALMNEGVKKLSFMTTRGYHTLNYDNDTIGKILAKEYDLLLGKTNFEEGF